MRLRRIALGGVALGLLGVAVRSEGRAVGRVLLGRNDAGEPGAAAIDRTRTDRTDTGARRPTGVRERVVSASAVGAGEGADSGAGVGAGAGALPGGGAREQLGFASGTGTGVPSGSAAGAGVWKGPVSASGEVKEHLVSVPGAGARKQSVSVPGTYAGPQYFSASGAEVEELPVSVPGTRARQQSLPAPLAPTPHAPKQSVPAPTPRSIFAENNAFHTPGHIEAADLVKSWNGSALHQTGTLFNGCPVDLLAIHNAYNSGSERDLTADVGWAPTLHTKIDSAAVADRQVARGAGAGRMP